MLGARARLFGAVPHQATSVGSLDSKAESDVAVLGVLLAVSVMAIAGTGTQQHAG